MASPERLNFERRTARLREFPIGQQFGAMDLGPSLDKATVSQGQRAAQEFQGVDREHRRVFLVVRVEVVVR